MRPRGETTRAASLKRPGPRRPSTASARMDDPTNGSPGAEKIRLNIVGSVQCRRSGSMPTTCISPRCFANNGPCPAGSPTRATVPVPPINPVKASNRSPWSSIRSPGCPDNPAGRPDRGGARKSPKPCSIRKESRQFEHPSKPSYTYRSLRRFARRMRPKVGPQRGQVSRSVSRRCTALNGSGLLDL